MSINIGCTAETLPGERRVALTPETAKKFRSLGAQLVVQNGAGDSAGWRDADYTAQVADAQWNADANAIIAQVNLRLCVQAPSSEQIALMPSDSCLVGMLSPYQSADRVKALAQQGVTAFALELLPRISRAQSMDVLSSQAACAGYQCVLIAASHCPKFFPMLTYAAGTIRPAKVLVVGAGVAGLQAIATARRLGAIVEAYDVRPETREQIESLGAKFVDTGVAAGGQGGYARELSSEEKQQQAQRLAKAVAQCDALITTAAIPGKRAPQIITQQMLSAMRPDSVVVDMAAESGGNVEGSRAGETITVEGVKLIGPSNLPSRMPTHASEMFAKNLYNFVAPMIKDGQLQIDWSDEVIAGACLTHGGEIKHAGVKQVLGL